jgi:hypothetical protein
MFSPNLSRGLATDDVRAKFEIVGSVLELKPFGQVASEKCPCDAKDLHR